MIVLIISCFAFCLSSCQKNNTDIQSDELAEQIENEVIEEPSVDVPDEIEDYDDEGTMKIESISGPKASAFEVSSWCQIPFKYSGFFTVGKQANAVTLTVNLSKYDSLLTAVSVNHDSLIEVSNLSRVDDTHYTFSCSTKSHLFTAKSIKFTFTSSRSVNGTPKTFKKSIKMVGVNQLGNIYGTQLWGLNTLGVSQITPSSAGTAIDSTYVPTLGDIIFFDHDEQRGVVTTAPEIVTTSASLLAKRGKKYKFQITQYNVRCKSARTIKKYSLYAADFKPTSAKFLNPNKEMIATKYYR